MQSLETLELPETNVTFAGLTQLAAHKNLKQLFLGGLTLTDDELATLRASMPHCRISFWTKPAIEYPDTGRRYGN
jgi:hypothetical protein